MEVKIHGAMPVVITSPHLMTLKGSTSTIRIRLSPRPRCEAAPLMEPVLCTSKAKRAQEVSLPSSLSDHVRVALLAPAPDCCAPICVPTPTATVLPLVEKYGAEFELAALER